MLSLRGSSDIRVTTSRLSRAWSCEEGRLEIGTWRHWCGGGIYSHRTGGGGGQRRGEKRVRRVSSWTVRPSQRGCLGRYGQERLSSWKAGGRKGFGEQPVRWGGGDEACLGTAEKTGRCGRRWATSVLSLSLGALPNQEAEKWGGSLRGM